MRWRWKALTYTTYRLIEYNVKVLSHSTFSCVIRFVSQSAASGQYDWLCYLLRILRPWLWLQFHSKERRRISMRSYAEMLRNNVRPSPAPRCYIRRSSPTPLSFVPPLYSFQLPTKLAIPLVRKVVFASSIRGSDLPHVLGQCNVPIDHRKQPCKQPWSSSHIPDRDRHCIANR
jgi:hypothetical protein